jgi:uncharacterized protein (DUF2235 family)
MGHIDLKGGLNSIDNGVGMHTAKNIVICSDGTGNSGGKARGTNVWSIFRGLARSEKDSAGRTIEQIAIYDDGVGTEKFLPLKILAGATGYGISNNLRQLYKEMVRVYRKGDHIWLFGFSRGAYTARTLAGMICTKGILKYHAFGNARELDDAVCDLYREFRKGSLKKTRVAPSSNGEAGSESTIDASPSALDDEVDDRYQNVPIQFIGVFDTVGAIGGPFPGFAEILGHFVRIYFPDYKLHPSVQRACHALSIDDARKSFEPILWEGDPRVKQIWFAGVHSNVGGGYPKDQMAYIALEWMIRESERAVTGESGPGPRLYFNESFKAMIRGEADECGQIYDSRDGLGAIYRLIPRNIEKICKDFKQDAVIHESVTHRIAMSTRDYAPAYVPMGSNIEPGCRGAKPSQGKIPAILQGDDDALNVALGIDRERKRLYWLFVTYTVVAPILFVLLLIEVFSSDEPDKLLMAGLVAIAVVFTGLVVHRTRLKKKSQLAALDYWARFRGDISCLNASERREKFWF